MANRLFSVFYNKATILYTDGAQHRTKGEFLYEQFTGTISL